MEFYQTKIRPWIGIIALLIIGIVMISQPEMSEGADASGRNSLLKSALIAIWGIPAGIGCVLAALGLGYMRMKGGDEEEKKNPE
ncbi:MAG: hypothetical protein R3D00_23700 [Bacteroidia bacterium]